MKRFLLSLLVVGLSFIGFSSAGIVSLSPIDNQGDGDYDWRQVYISENGTRTWSNPTNGLFCLQPDMGCQNCGTLTAGGQSVQTAGRSYFYCTTDSTITYQSNYAGDLRYYYMLFTRPAIKELFPDYTSEQCQSEYDLVPNGSTDIFVTVGGDYDNLYTVDYGDTIYLGLVDGIEYTFDSSDNNFNFSYQCTGSSSSGSDWSALFINNIQHLGSPIINISIPDMYYWDYARTDSEFNLYIGSGYDQEYIDGVVAVNSYQPTSEDFTNVFVGGLTLIMPYIFLALLILFIRKLVKRIFK